MKRLLVAAAIAGVAAGCAPSSKWTDIDSIDALEDAFNRDRGNVRLVLILSPT